MDLIRRASKERIYPVGRLDRLTTGLLMFTNDGEMCNRLTHPKYQIKKIYLVDLIGDVEENDLNQLLNGVREDGEILKADAVKIKSLKKGFARVEITLTEGKKREIRRMARVLGYHVKRLRRIQFGPLSLGQYDAGFSRQLNEEELASLKQETGL